ncbi:MAG: hypothetical protein EZS28_036614, partial [Streblomastix strix]
SERNHPYADGQSQTGYAPCNVLIIIKSNGVPNNFWIIDEESTLSFNGTVIAAAGVSSGGKQSVAYEKNKAIQ